MKFFDEFWMILKPKESCILYWVLSFNENTEFMIVISPVNSSRAPPISESAESLELLKGFDISMDSPLAVVRNPRGTGLLELHTGEVSAFEAELWAIYYGVDLALRFDNKVIVKSQKYLILDCALRNASSTELVKFDPIVTVIQKAIARVKERWNGKVSVTSSPYIYA